MSETKNMPVEIVDWRAFTKGSLLGFLKIRLGALEISDVTVMRNNGSTWCGLPAKPQVGADDKVKRDQNSRIVYAQIIRWSSKEAGERFNRSVLAALEEKHPDALR